MGAKFYPKPAVEDIRLVDVLRALSDPGRVRMLMTLADGQFHGSNTDAFSLDLQKSTLSHHLKTLREAGITETRVVGRNCEVRLRTEDLEARFPGLIEALTSSSAVADVALADA